MALAFSISLGASVSLGLLFLLVSLVGMFLMFKLWGYPEIPATHERDAPMGWRIAYRVTWWIYLVIYLVMMSQMLPRMWQYQIEFPPRTVMHIVIGITLGLLLLLKFSFARFFRHLHEWIPVLAVLLTAGTILLSGLSVPFALQEVKLASSAVGGGVFSMENRQRVSKLLTQAELPADAPLEQLASVQGLTAGREVLASKCVVCHDLKTILVQPRTPSGWWRTVERMGDKPTFTDPMTEQELYVVTSYLIAISGDLQRSVKARKEVEDKRSNAVAEVKQGSKEVAKEAKATDTGDLPPFDEAVAAKTYETLCAQCHDLAEVDAHPPKTSEDVKNVIIRMISENGMQAERSELDLVYLHMVKKYAGGKVLAAPAPAAEPAADPGTGTVAKNPDATDPVPTPDEVSQVAKPDGKALYDKHCKGCHSVDGKGSAGMKKIGIPDLTDPAWQAAHAEAAVTEAISVGVEGTKMKAFKEKLKPEEIAAVSAYVKQLK
jgi:mono/diheme cytochrome c family protein